MNDSSPGDLPKTPDEIPSDDRLTQAHSVDQPRMYWLRRLLACTPFYLVSAALLLYGFYLVSIDPRFLNQETKHLVFNFTSLQIYELVLVLTAIFLAARRIWYDSTLLVILENL